MREVKFFEAVQVWLRIGLLSFGGPAGQIALMHRLLVEEKQWIDESRFLHALNYCMLLPGPEAQQLATYVGWLLHGVKGGIVAGVLFILPGAVAIFLLSWLYVSVGDLAVVEGLFFGLKAAVLAIVIQALMKVAQRALKNGLMRVLAVAAFVALFVFDLPFVLVIFSAAVIGFLNTKSITPHQQAPISVPNTLEASQAKAGAHRAAGVCLLLWLLTLGSVMALLGVDHVLAHIALFFSKMAIVTFGGAYAVLAYVAQQGVEQYQWLQPNEMMQGLGLAETTPGPLILVTQFVGFLAAYRSTAEPSIMLASLGALLTLWVTFLPSFLWIFAGVPYMEKLRANTALSAALAAVTAAVVGVIANLALWFAVNALFTEQRLITGVAIDMQLPILPSVDWPMLLLSICAMLLLFKLRLGVFSLLGVAAVLGMGWVWVAEGV